ncbi:MAG: hypothetical protein ACYC08_08845 [Armatimonadota bacterium]
MRATKVCVVGFRNVSKVSDALFASMATDATVVEMLRSGFDVTPSDTMKDVTERVVDRPTGDRGDGVVLTPPVLQRLGEELGVSNVVQGEIVSLSIDKEKKKASVRIAVRMLDVASGEWVNGAVASGQSYPRIGYTSDKDADLVVEAINEAARNAVGTMVKYIIPEATVLGTIGTREILLNKGSQDGLQVGMPMIVIRRTNNGEEVVGRVRITTLSDTDARAQVEQSTRGVRPEDRVRAVYELPADTGGKGIDAPRSSKSKSNKGKNLILGIALLALLWGVSGHGGSQTEDLPDAVAMSGATPDIVDDWGSTTDLGILVAWNNAKNILSGNVVEYHVWRDNVGIGSGVDVGPAQSTSHATAMPWTGTSMGSFDHHVVDDESGWAALLYRFIDGDDHSGLAEATVAINGASIGAAHRYWVSCLYKRLDQTTSEYTYWETDPVYAGRATMVIQPVPSTPGTGDTVDLSDVTFTWEGSLGADEYVIEVSANHTFPRDTTWVSGPFFQPTSADGQILTKRFSGSSALSVSSELSGIASGTTLYWRVGARNSQDSPGPYPAGPSPANGGAKSTRFIYSAASTMPIVEAL